MKLNLKWLLVAMLSLSLGACEEESDPQPTTEVWSVIMDNDPLRNGEETFVKNNDGSITSSGTWDFDGVVCTYQNGVLVVNDTLITFTDLGTATNSAAPTGYKTSSFDLSVEGTAHSGQGIRNWG